MARCRRLRWPLLIRHSIHVDDSIILNSRLVHVTFTHTPYEQATTSHGEQTEHGYGAIVPTAQLHTATATTTTATTTTGGRSKRVVWLSANSCARRAAAHGNRRAKSSIETAHEQRRDFGKTAR
jgi:hypothetical protein